MMLRKLLLLLMRIGAGIQIVLGTGFWTGHWYAAVPVHMTNGIVYVLMFWTLATIALFQRRHVGLALFSILWGAVIAMLGFTQQGILAGSDWHWVVRVVHLSIGWSAVSIAERLAGVGRPVAASPVPAVV
jgi:hypothetical protein